MTTTELLQRWRFRVHRVQLAHYDAARRFGRHHLLLGLPAIILSTIVGTTVFASLGQFADKESIKLITVLVGLLSVTSAVFVSLQTFLRYSELAEKHRIIGARSTSLKHKIELLGTLPPKSKEELETILIQVEKEWAKLREESPNIPTKIWARIEKTLTFKEHEERYPGFADSILPNN